MHAAQADITLTIAALLKVVEGYPNLIPLVLIIISSYIAGTSCLTTGFASTIMNAALPNESELLRQLIAGNPVAFDHIYKHYHRSISIFAFRFTKSKPAAEEVVQEVFIKLWEHRHQIEPGYHFESYIKTIARNHILNILKKTARDKVLQAALLERMQTLGALPSDRLAEKELELLHEQAIFSLPPRQKMAYILRKQEGLSYQQIARKLHVSKNTVKNQTTEAIRTIRRQLSRIITFLSLIFLYLH